MEKTTTLQKKISLPTISTAGRVMEEIMEKFEYDLK